MVEKIFCTRINAWREQLCTSINTWWVSSIAKNNPLNKERKKTLVDFIEKLEFFCFL